jgi:tRNA nucleotidyltransferase (CCA-adding enzyme)
MVVGIKDKNLYYVGGVVRDEILGVPSFDVDLCYEGNAIEFARSKGFEIIRENPVFGTVRVLIDSEEVDIASTRTESYPKKGHLPLVDKIGCSLNEDLSRRDFTINALAKNTVTGEIVDYFNGLDDLKNKKLRILHENSFIDDPTRIIRGLKFAVRFGFDLDEVTKGRQEDYLSNINYDMCYHRIKKELKETFNLNSQLAYEKFYAEGIYKLLGNSQKTEKTLSLIEALVSKYSPEYVWLVYLGAFDLSNLDLTKEENGIILAYQNIKNIVPQSDFEIYKLFKDLPLESLLLYAIYSNHDVVIKYI